MTPQRQKVYYPLTGGKKAGLGPHPLSRVANKIAYPQLREMGWTNQADPNYGPAADRLRELIMLQMLANPKMHDLEFVNDPMDIDPERQAEMKGKSLEDVFAEFNRPGDDHKSFMTPKQQRAAERENAMRSGTKQVQTLAGKAGQSKKLQAMQDSAQAKNAESYGFPMPEGAKELFDEEGNLSEKLPAAPDMSASARAPKPVEVEPETPPVTGSDAFLSQMASLSPEDQAKVLEYMRIGLSSTVKPPIRDPGEGGDDDMYGKAFARSTPFNDAWRIVKRDWQQSYDADGNVTPLGPYDWQGQEYFAHCPVCKSGIYVEQEDDLYTLQYAKKCLECLLEEDVMPSQTSIPEMRDPGEGGDDDMYGKAFTRSTPFNDAWSLMKQSWNPYLGGIDPIVQKECEKCGHIFSIHSSAEPAWKFCENCRAALKDPDFDGSDYY